MRRATRQALTLADLKPDELNANRGTSRGRELLRHSLESYGAGRSIVLDQHLRTIAGHKTVEQAKKLGLPIHVVKTDGRVLVAVQRTDLDLHKHSKARALAIADNRVGELDLQWDSDVLEQLRAQGLDVSHWWTDHEWAELTGAPLASDPREDEVLAPGETTIRRGDGFALGRHRLLCGDATDPTDVSRLLGDDRPLLMAVDPPYGVNYDPSWRHRVYPRQRTAVGAVTGDDQASWTAAFRLFTGDVVYAWHAGLQSATAAQALQASGFELKAQVIWHKPHYALGRSLYHWGHEPCFFAVRRGARTHWRGDRTQSTVWTVPNLNPLGGNRTGDNVPTGHSTQKPVRLFEIPMLNHTKDADAVYDPFVGSGTTLIAAEKLGRRALVMDIDPKYVQVTITRWETYTGKRATRLRPPSRRRS
jgi:DNA modification methylase